MHQSQVREELGSLKGSSMPLLPANQGQQLAPTIPGPGGICQVRDRFPLALEPEQVRKKNRRKALPGNIVYYLEKCVTFSCWIAHLLPAVLQPKIQPGNLKI